ncbi:MAG: DUF1156 domain-containing protein, partial [Deltaproteobacteria bacterium]|nr:DUF1156 domain-containing protein [Deltaproteobacteria bacterium]
MTYRKKLIEVALPLDAINRESAREKSIRHGHPSTLHLWWARRPLAACRAVLFAQLVDDPSANPERFPTEKDQRRERERLFRIIREMVRWENINNQEVLERARAEIMRSTGDNPPPVLDPFCGGGSIPLEAQRLGLKAYGSDLNPVAVLITKALIEIPPRFAERAPVYPGGQTSSYWHGAKGLAEDVRHYGRWMRDEAEKRIGHLYPKVRLPEEQGGGEATVIAWLWARTVKCPNPACGARMPLVRSFWLSKKKGKKAWVEPVVDGNGYRFQVRTGEGQPRQGTVERRGATCLCCGTPVPLDHVRSEGRAGRMGQRLMAIVAEGHRGRVYVGPDKGHQSIAFEAVPENVPDTNLPEHALGFRVQLYGMIKHRDLFTPRQLVALTTFSDLVMEARERVREDALAAGMSDDGKGINDGGTGATAYADAVATYLGFAVDKGANYWSTICAWHQTRDGIVSTFGRQAIPMVWDYAEANPLSQSSGNVLLGIEQAARMISDLGVGKRASVLQADAAVHSPGENKIISTDPPYYDNIGYADLSDFFYVWLRRSLGKVYPDLFSTMLVPKAEELVATPYRFDGDRQKAKIFFETGLKKAFEKMRGDSHSDYPLAVYYAFKQAESSTKTRDSNGKQAFASTGWETMLEGLFLTGFQITGTWPMRTELITNLKKHVSALASS